jgi:hypothetical protein
MNSLPHFVQKYLQKNFNPTWKIETRVERTFNNIIVIPATAEFNNIKLLLKSLAENDPKYISDTLTLFVINNTASAGSEIKSQNKSTITYLHDILYNNINDDLTECIRSSGINLSYINASTQGFELPEKDGGVGLARKIGMDLSLKYFNYSIPGKKIMICTDADCTFEKNYINSIVDYFNLKNCGAAVVNYEHSMSGSTDITRAIICYELYLRYYLLGLSYAGSSYAFHTIGSTMICDHECYIKIGGMNKLKAAEDFYFLEKLSKITEIHTIRNTCVYPSPRPSFRVPFGTGQRVNRFLSKVRNEYLIYDPQSFIVLKHWIDLLDSLTASNLHVVLNESKSVDPYLHKFLEENKFVFFWEKICSENLSEQQLARQKKFWFDAFRTLKLIHYLRDNAYPLTNVFDAIDKMLEISGIQIKILRERSALPDLDKQKEYLLLLRKLQNN